MRVLAFLAVAAFGLLTLSAADASHCATWSTSTTDIEHGRLVLEIGDSPFGGAIDYVFYDVCQPDCVFSFGFYAEQNGIPGLQRADAAVDDTCHGLIRGDLWTG